MAWPRCNDLVCASWRFLLASVEPGRAVGWVGGGCECARSRGRTQERGLVCVACGLCMTRCCVCVDMTWSPRLLSSVMSALFWSAASAVTGQWVRPSQRVFCPIFTSPTSETHTTPTNHHTHALPFGTRSQDMPVKRRNHGRSRHGRHKTTLVRLRNHDRQHSRPRRSNHRVMTHNDRFSWWPTPFAHALSRPSLAKHTHPCASPLSLLPTTGRLLALQLQARQGQGDLALHLAQHCGRIVAP
jgi:hypothetical protein